MTPEEEYARRTFESHVGKTAGSSSSLTPGAGDATQVAKDGQPGSPSDGQPDFVTPDGGMHFTLTSRPSDVALPPYARRLDVRATRAAFAAGTLGTVRDDALRENVKRDVEVRNADRHNADVMHDAKCGWTEAERQAFLRRVQFVDPGERRA